MDWEPRARDYNKLAWTKADVYLEEICQIANLSLNDEVLDVGTGTGIIAKNIADRVRLVVGIDTSQDMLDIAAKHCPGNVVFIKNSITKLSYRTKTFTKVIARMVFHHILKDREKAIKECYRVLKPKGTMILSEGVPPSRGTVKFYTDMFKLKEERVTFNKTSLKKLMKSAGFVDIKIYTHILKQMSIKNWLNNSGLPKKTQQKIYQMHLGLHEQGKKDYRMTITKDDILIDMKFLILKGTK